MASPTLIASRVGFTSCVLTTCAPFITAISVAPIEPNNLSSGGALFNILLIDVFLLIPT